MRFFDVVASLHVLVKVSVVQPRARGGLGGGRRMGGMAALRKQARHLAAVSPDAAARPHRGRASSPCARAQAADYLG